MRRYKSLLQTLMSAGTFAPLFRVEVQLYEITTIPACIHKIGCLSYLLE
jgi:hypothetical protein